jgi:predicted ATPase
VGQLLADGPDLTPGVTRLIGENGSGESTIVEALAQAFFLRAEPMHSLFSYLEQDPGQNSAERPFRDMSHGESFLAREDGQVVVATHSPARGAAGGFGSGAGTWATRHLLD